MNEQDFLEMCRDFFVAFLCGTAVFSWGMVAFEVTR